MEKFRILTGTRGNWNSDVSFPFKAESVEKYQFVSKRKYVGRTLPLPPPRTQNPPRSEQLTTHYINISDFQYGI